MTDFTADQDGQTLGHGYGTFCDDFYVNMRLGSHLPLTGDRGTRLHFLEQMQKAFPGLQHLQAGSDGETLHLEEPREAPSYRWVGLEPRRLCTGHVNPAAIVDAARLHELVLKIAPYQLGVSPIEIDYLDVLIGFDIEFNGDHDEVVADTLFRDSPLACLLGGRGARPLEFSPTTTVFLDDDRSLQARLEVLTRTGSVNRGGEAGGGVDDDVLSVYFTLRRHWQPRPEGSLEAVYRGLLARADELVGGYVVPEVLRPISGAIASRS